MDVEMKMPDVATTEAEVKVVEWLIATGAPVRRGEALLRVETDKATVDIESHTAGVLAEIRAQPGDEVLAGDVIAVIRAESDAGAAPAPARTTPAPQLAAQPVQAKPRTPRGMFARNREAARNVQTRDEQRAEGIPLGVAHRKMAHRMQQAKQTIPHFYLQTSADAEPMAARRDVTTGERPAWDAFFVCAAARALRRYGRMACRFRDDRLVPSDTDTVGVAVDIEGDLYVVPIVNSATKTPEEVSGEIRAQVQRIREGDADAKALRPGSITVTNLGVAGVESFIPIINPPEAAILGVGRVAPVPAVRDGKIITQLRVTLTLAADHRVVSGRYAGGFLGEVVKEIEAL